MAGGVFFWEREVLRKEHTEITKNAVRARKGYVKAPADHFTIFARVLRRYPKQSKPERIKTQYVA